MNPAGTHKPSLARTVTMLFLLVAVLPLGVCAAILFGKFSEQVNQTQIDHFDETLRTFGNTVLGRLISADDVLTSLVNAPGATSENVTTQLHPVDWLQAAQLVSDGAQPPAPLSSTARSSLAAGKSILTWRVDGSQPSVYLAHRLGKAGVLFAQIKTRWLWDDAPSFAGRAYLGIMDNEGRILASSGDVAPPKRLAIQSDGGRDSHQLVVDNNLNGRAWDLFLGGQFTAPSWRLVMVSAKPSLFANQNGRTYLYLLGFLVLTILGMSWASMVAIRRQLQPLRDLSRATQRLAQREFDAFQGLHWENEFGELAHSFQNMAAKLKLQFGVLDSLSDVDRQLLNAPRLESILEALLPQVADLLSCETVSLVLFDSRDRTARGFDYVRGKINLVTARPIELSAAVTQALEGAASGKLPAESLELLRSILPSDGKPLRDVQVQSLGKEGECGVLCLGYAEHSRPGTDATLSAEDFADRLTLVLANLKQAETLRQQAHYDALTGLENRERFAANAAAAVAHASSSGSQGYLLYIDLDQFKQVNDTAGHAAGDELLKVVANRIRGCISAHHVARLGGDEFAVLAPQVASADEALLQAQRIIAALERDIEIDGRHHRISASIGIGLFPTHAHTVDELLKAGDIAMYIAKAAGRGRAQVFQPDMQQRLNEQVRMEKQLLEALEQNEFVLHYQPIVDESVGSVAAEALVRWANPRTGEQVPPAKFVPLAEANGLIVRLGDWILRHACRQYAAWRDLGLHLTYISVNVSVRQLQEPNYCDGLMAALREYGLRADQLQIEVTESVLAHEGSIRPTLEGIASLGVRLALDDFGTGYSSLSYLRSFPIHSVKIDRSFIMELPHDSVSCQLTSSIIAMCVALGKRVTAEGVETSAQRSYLRGLGCTSIQGYLLARPMESIDIPGFVMRLRETAAPSEPRHRRATAQ